MDEMKLILRWHGEKDPISLRQYAQIPNLYGIVTSLYHLPLGQVWDRAEVLHLKEQIEAHGLRFEVVDSFRIHEDIKRGLPSRDALIERYQANIRMLAECGIKIICYNFMPVFDWTRTQLDKVLADGSNALVYYKDQLEKMDPLTGELSLPGWDSSYRKEDLKALFEEYGHISEENLWENLQYFLEAVIPVAEESGGNMAIHPDDPPWNIFGLPRIITGKENLDRFLKLVDSPANGLTFCTGSLGCTKANDIYSMIDEYSKMGRIHFMHVRNVKILDDGSFEESAHFSACGSLDIPRIMKILHDNGFTGYVRPDHGRMIWGETGRAGYGLYDRALGAAYLNGIWETLDKYAKESVS